MPFCPIFFCLPYLERCSTDSNTIGNMGGVASVDWGLAVQIMAAASIGSGLTFTPTVAQTLYVQSYSYARTLVTVCAYFQAPSMLFCYAAMPRSAVSILR